MQVKVPQGFDWTILGNAVERLARWRAWRPIPSQAGDREPRGDFVNTSDGVLKLIEDAGSRTPLSA